VDVAYGQRYRLLYERHWWWRAREAVVLRELERFRPGGGWRRALDVGCGDGLLLDVLGGYASSVEGLEPDRDLVSAARADRIHVRPFDAAFQPGRTYDLILLLDVLEHLDQVESAVAHARALLDPGGVIVVTVPAFRHLWTTHDDLNHHVTRYTKRRLLDLFSDGFQVMEARYFFRWVYPAKIVQRLLERARRPHPAPPQVPADPVNSALYLLSRFEEALLRRAPLPFGSSLLAVARKLPDPDAPPATSRRLPGGPDP
jgi:2-polyprenyl-3-methyl-5-hydroxy-6-metoxy-1,4-benzoquinol methylase